KITQDGNGYDPTDLVRAWTVGAKFLSRGIERCDPPPIGRVVEVEERRRQRGRSLLPVDHPPGLPHRGCFEPSTSHRQGARRSLSFPEQQGTDRISAPDAVQKSHHIGLLPA